MQDSYKIKVEISDGSFFYLTKGGEGWSTKSQAYNAWKRFKTKGLELGVNHAEDAKILLIKCQYNEENIERIE